MSKFLSVKLKKEQHSHLFIIFNFDAGANANVTVATIFRYYFKTVQSKQVFEWVFFVSTFFTIVLEAVLITNCGHKLQMFLCCKNYFNISWQMIWKHSEEKNVKEVMLLIINSTKRCNAWEKIISQRNFNGKIQIMKKEQPPQFLARKSESNDAERIPCSMCKGFLKDFLLYP